MKNGKSCSGIIEFLSDQIEYTSGAIFNLTKCIDEIEYKPSDKTSARTNVVPMTFFENIETAVKFCLEAIQARKYLPINSPTLIVFITNSNI